MKLADIMTIVQQLQARQLITPAQLTQAQIESQRTGVDLLTVLVQEHIVNEEELTQVKAMVLRVPYISLLDQDIPSEILNAFTPDIAENYRVVPWARNGSELSVAMVDPQDYKAIEALDFIARKDHLQIKYFLTSESSFRAVLHQYANLTKEVAQALKEQNTDLVDVLQDEAEELADADPSVKNAPVSKMVAVILRYAVEGSASDVHIEPHDDGTRVRYRVDGILHTSLQLPKNVHNSLVARIKVLANLKLDETRLPQDGRFRMKIDGRQIDFRVSTMPLIDHEKVVLRILDQESGLQTLEDLGFADRNLSVIHEHLQRPHGMILMTGPTGSGKSTTLYSMLQILNNEERNIITLEDPVEYHMTGIAQSQVRPEIGLTFVRGLRSILRQDPDIIMVGEIRDNETAELAIHAALTGHMLLSTLHTNDAIGAIPRLIDMGIEPFLISSALNLVIAQRLVRRNCMECLVPEIVPPLLESQILAELERIPKSSLPKGIVLQPPLKVFKGKGCQHCEDTGYKGRLAVAETVEVTDRLRAIIAAGDIHTPAVVEEELRHQGMVTIKQNGLLAALRGLTSIEEVWTVGAE
ncbi:MAG: type II/IV secretion system protein [Candidatus Kerfeldbacteria bacterium]|nr:type II/IV secretion system protein [Candidatus Kerfeldbacteria bacterium]